MFLTFVRQWGKCKELGWNLIDSYETADHLTENLAAPSRASYKLKMNYKNACNIAI